MGRSRDHDRRHAAWQVTVDLRLVAAERAKVVGDVSGPDHCFPRAVRIRYRAF
jgi:hypothetical protein